MLIGTGRLTWTRGERVSDRYGYVYLLKKGDSLTDYPDDIVELRVPQGLLGRPATLVAVVLEVRESTHIGDLFHNVLPRTPQVGDRFVLGSGILSIKEYTVGLVGVGLEPADGREDLWLSVRALYDCHEQTVDLFVEPEENSAVQ